MQQVNDDMDELFRRAAEGYPLNTDGADWNAVGKKLSAQKSVADNTTAKNKNYKYLLWLLLLLPLGLMYKNYISDNKDTHSDTILKNSLNKNLTDEPLSKNIDSKSNDAKLFTVAPNKSLAVINSSGIKRKDKVKLNSNSKENDDPVFIPDKQSLIVDPVAELSYKKKSEFISEQDNKKNIAGNNNEIQPVKLNDNKKDEDSLFKNNIQEITESLQKKNRKQKEHGLYAGIVFSPDISTVKFQSIKKIGVSMGVLVGYQINKRISVESGVSWSIKNYYTDGKYFSTTRVYTNSTAKIKKVDGVCNMIEIPLTIKYNLTTGKTNFSTSAGLSSYLIKNEKYNYTINNSGQQYQHSATYSNSSTVLLAVANFSVGYNKALKKNISLRIEPYIKIPLKGMGIGSLPIMSTGFNIGITKKITR